MFAPLRLDDQAKILIPTHKRPLRLLNWVSLSFLLILIFAPESIPSPPRHAMKVRPMPTKKRNITFDYDVGSVPSVGSHQNKKLRRLPHVFSRVLELPFRSDSRVEVDEGPGFFRFVAVTDGVCDDVRAHTIEIYPGITKVVVRLNESLELLPLDQLELDMWRFRLPQSTRPELASAVCVDGELIVTVPKGDEDEVGEGEVWEGGNGNRLVLVQ